MALENILSQEIVQKLGWTLLHFIWQAAAVALLLGILLAVLRKSSANLRYIVACAALGLIVLLPIATMQLVPVSVPQPTANIEPAPAPVIMSAQEFREIPAVEMSIPEGPVQHENAGTAYNASWKQRAADLLEPALPYIVSAWLLGVFGLSLWHLGGWAQLQRLRKKLVKQVDDSLYARLSRLSEKLRIKQAVQLTESALVQVPTVVGWLRPVILLPASALTGLSSEQLEALLAHELAHIRRYDYLINMLQTLVETLGFYHPAVWWVSHKIRIERENCCDDLAVSISGDRFRYARALTSMEEIRGRRNELAVAAAGGNLFGRIRRLVGKDSTEPSRTSWIPSVITILLIAIIVIPTTLALNSQAEDKIGDGLKINAEGQQILKLMAERNHYWLIGPPTEVRNYSYDFNLHSSRYLREREPERATGPKTIEVENPSAAEKKMAQGITYSSVLQKLAINPSAATITKVEHDKTKERIRLDFTLSEKATGYCGNGISGLHFGRFGWSVSSGSLWLDAKNNVPIELKAGELMEYFSEYVEAGKSQYVPLRIGIHKYKTDDGQDRSMHFDFKFSLFGSGLWLFDQSSYRQGKFDLPLSDKSLVAYTSNIKINGAPRQKTDIDVKSSKAAARSGLKELDLRSQSINDLLFLRAALKPYTKNHDGKYPVDLEALRAFAEEYPWILENTEYLGKGKTVAESSDTIIAYDSELLNKIGGTNVLFNDSRIVFLGPEQLDEKLQESSSDLKVEENKQQLNDILEKFSDGKTTDKPDNNSKSVRDSVENYIAAALAGEDEKAAEYVYPDTAVASQTKDMREALQDQNIRIVGMCIGEWNSLAISSVIQADHGRTGSIVFHLKKMILDEKVHWLIDDIDLEMLDTIGDQIIYFLNNVPDAKIIIVNPDTYTHKQTDAAVENARAGTEMPASSTAGPVGRRALLFDGVDDCLHVPASPTLELKPPFTIEMWIKPDFSEGDRIKASGEDFHGLSLLRKGKKLQDERKVQTEGLALLLRPSSVGSVYFGDGRHIMDKTSLLAGDGSALAAHPGWLHISASCMHKEYISVPDQPLVIGEAIKPLFLPPFKGQIAEIRIWNKELSEAESRRYGQTSLTGSEPNLIAYWDFEHTEGQMVYDISPNGNHAYMGMSPETDSADPIWVNPDGIPHQTDRKTDTPVETNEGRIEGRIIDINTGRGISSVQLAVVPNSSPALSDRFVCTSAEDGTFAIDGLQTGEYLLRGDFPSVDVDVISGRCTNDVLIGVRRGETVPAPIETTAEQQRGGQIMIGMSLIEIPADTMKDVFEPNESLSSGLFVRHGHEITGRLLRLAQERKDVELLITNAQMLMMNNGNAVMTITDEEKVYIGDYESAEGEPGKLTAQNKFLEAGWKYKFKAEILESGEKVHIELAARQQTPTFETLQYQPGYDYQIPSPPEIFVAEMTAKNGEPVVVCRLRPGEPALCLIVTPSALVPERQPEPLLGKKLPEPDNIQNIDSLKQTEGKRILVCFWDMNQRPSRNLIGELAKREKELARKDVEVLLVHASNVESAKLKQWLDNRKIPFACGNIEIDTEKVLFAWGVRAQPWLILTDQQGVVRAEGFNIEQLDEKLQVKIPDVLIESREKSTASVIPSASTLAKNPKLPTEDKAQIQLDCVVLEVSPPLKMDKEIKNMLSDFPTSLDPPMYMSSADLLLKEAAGDKRTAQERIGILIDKLVSGGRAKIRMHPTIQLAEVQTHKFETAGSFLQVTPNAINKDVSIYMSLKAAFHSKFIQDHRKQNPIVTRREFANFVNIRSGEILIIGGEVQRKEVSEGDNNATNAEEKTTDLVYILTPVIIDATGKPQNEIDEPIETQQEQRSSGRLLAKSAAPSDVDKPIVRIDLSVVEVFFSDMKMDRETTIKIENLLGGKITLPDSHVVADLLKKAAGATATVKDESTGDKRVTQEQFTALLDTLVSRGYVKILLRPTLEVVDGQAAKIQTNQDSIQITPNVLEDGNIILQVEATLSSQSISRGNEQPPIINKRQISTRIRLSPGESGIIGGMKQAGLLTEPGRAANYPEAPATEMLVILTPTIVAQVAEPQKQMQPDIPKAAILIKTRILTVSDEFMKYIGLDPNSVASSKGWSNYLVHSSDDSASFVIDQLHTDSILKAAAAHENIGVLTAPQVLALSGKKCEIHILESEYYILIPPSEPNGSSDGPESKLNSIELGTTVRLTPTLTPDGENVDLDFEWESRQLRGFKEHPGPDGNVQKIPQVAVESIKTPCTVPDGKTLLITGKHITKQKKKEPRKPGLADLPLIGGLFYSPPQVEETKNLLILVKPIFGPQKIAQATRRPKPQPLDPNDPLIKQLEEKFKRSAEPK